MNPIGNNLGLATLAGGISSAELLGELLERYHKPLLEARQFESAVVLACLEPRVAAVGKIARDAVMRCQAERLGVRGVVQALTDLAAPVSGVHSILCACDKGTGIEMAARGLTVGAVEIHQCALSIMRAVLAQEAAVLGFNATGLELLHGRARILAGDGGDQERMVAVSIREATTQLVSSRKAIAVSTARGEAVRLVEALIRVCGQYQHLEEMVRQARCEPGLPEQVPVLVDAVREGLVRVEAAAAEAVNTLYLGEEARRCLLQAMDSYLHLYRRWQIDGETVSGEPPPIEAGTRAVAAQPVLPAMAGR